MDLGCIASKWLSRNLENGAEAVAAHTLTAIISRCIVRDCNVEAATIFVVIIVLVGLVAMDIRSIALQILTGCLEDGTFAGATRTLTAVFGLGGRGNIDVEAHGKLIGLFALLDGLDPFAFGIVKGLLVVVIIVVAVYLERIANKFLTEGLEHCARVCGASTLATLLRLAWHDGSLSALQKIGRYDLGLGVGYNRGSIDVGILQYPFSLLLLLLERSVVFGRVERVVTVHAVGKTSEFFSKTFEYGALIMAANAVAAV